MNIEARLAELIGPVAGRLHTARSRNDQVALDFRLWIRDTIDALDQQLRGLQLALAGKALAHAESVMPGFTHLQPAQPVTFGHHLLAYVEMFSRDRSRLRDARARLNESPLGAAALAGTSFPIDRAMTAKALGFDRPDGEFARQRGGSRFRSRNPERRRDLRHSSVPPRRGDRALGDAAIRLYRLVGQFFDRLLDHAAKAQSRRGGTDTRQGGPHHRRAQRAADRDEGTAARLFEGYAGRQGRHLRRAAFAFALHRRHDGDGRRPHARSRRA